MTVAYVFPGQGSQRVGMGRDLYEGFAAARAVFEQADEALGFPLSRLCFDGPEDELTHTVNAQPAIVATSLACLKVFEEVNGRRELSSPVLLAGHSLGEYTALAVAGVLDTATTVLLARERGRLMYQAGQETPGGMVAVLGFDEAALAEVCRETGAKIVNINCPGQLVISGPTGSLTEAVRLVRSRGSYRTIPLQVSGAFHTPLMQSAVDGMAAAIATLPFREPVVPIIGNTTARPLTTAEEIKEELLRQLCDCVRWQPSVEYMIASGVDTFIEIGPGKVLTGLIKRISKDVSTLNIGDAVAAREIITN